MHRGAHAHETEICADRLIEYINAPPPPTFGGIRGKESSPPKCPFVGREESHCKLGFNMLKQIGLKSSQKFSRQSRPLPGVQAQQHSQAFKQEKADLRQQPMKRVRREAMTDQIIHRVRTEVLGRYRDKDSLHTQISNACSNLKAAEHVTSTCVSTLGQIKAKLDHHKRRLDHVNADISALRTKQRDPDDSDFSSAKILTAYLSKMLQSFDDALDALTLYQENSLARDYTRHMNTKNVLQARMMERVSNLEQGNAKLDALRRERQDCDDAVQKELAYEKETNNSLLVLERTTNELSNQVQNQRANERVLSEDLRSLVKEVETLDATIVENEGEAETTSLALKDKVDRENDELVRVMAHLRGCEAKEASVHKELVEMKCNLACIETEIGDLNKISAGQEADLYKFGSQIVAGKLSLEENHRQLLEAETQCNELKEGAVRAIEKHDATLQHTQSSLNVYFASHEQE